MTLKIHETSDSSVRQSISLIFEDVSGQNNVTQKSLPNKFIYDQIDYNAMKMDKRCNQGYSSLSNRFDNNKFSEKKGRMFEFI